MLPVWVWANWPYIRRYQEEIQPPGVGLLLENGAGSFLTEDGVDRLVTEYTGSLFTTEDGAGHLLYENAITMSTEAV